MGTNADSNTLQPKEADPLTELLDNRLAGRAEELTGVAANSQLEGSLF